MHRKNEENASSTTTILQSIPTTSLPPVGPPQSISFKELNNQGMAEFKNGKFKDAADIFKKLIRLYNKNLLKTTIESHTEIARLYFNLGCVESNLREYQSALEHLDKAIKLTKPDSEHFIKYTLRNQRILAEAILSTIKYAPDETLLKLYETNTPRIVEIFKIKFQHIKTEIENTPEGKDYIIVSLGCGKADEFYALWLFLGDILFKKIKYIGIDTEKDDISCLTQFANLCQLSQLSFHCMDARNLDAIKVVTGTANWIILRHPEVLRPANNTNPFWSILENTVPALAKTDGTNILISTFVKEECELAYHLLMRHGRGISIQDRLCSEEKSAKTETNFYPESYIIISNNYAFNNVHVDVHKATLEHENQIRTVRRQA